MSFVYDEVSRAQMLTAPRATAENTSAGRHWRLVKLCPSGDFGGSSQKSCGQTSRQIGKGSLAGKLQC